VRWPRDLEAEFHDVDVAIVRTEPAYEGQPEIREVEALYLATISAARFCDAIARRLAETAGPEVVVVNPKRAEGWLEEETMGSARTVLLERLHAADHERRLRILTPVTEGGEDIYVHAKVLVVDDTLLRMGSSNINNRSLGLDTECDLAVEARPDDPRAPELRRAILAVRDTLLAEHLGVPRDELRRTLDVLVVKI